MNTMTRTLSFVALVTTALLFARTQAHAQDATPAAPPAETTSETTAPQMTETTAPPVTETPRGASLYVAHAPVSETRSGELTLTFAVTPVDRVDAVLVRWRARTAGAQVHESIVTRHADGWIAEIRDAELAPPGIVYWVVRRDPGEGDPRAREHAVFASAAEPHDVVVYDSEVDAYARRMLERREGRRYRAGASFEYVSLGKRTLPAGVSGPRAASYWRTAASFGYSFFGVVDAIRFELGVLRGEQQVVGFDATPTTQAIGFNWGSGELLFRVHELVRIRSRLIFGVSQEGFELGGALGVVIGDPDGTSLELGGEGVTGLGVTGRLRLGWATVPRVPMGATIELTTFPIDDAAGVRLLFDAAYEIYPGALIRVTGGYRGWTSVAGGPSLAADLVIAF